MRQTKLQKFVVKSLNNTANFLKRNPNVFFSVSDKGSQTVISTVEDYDSKLLALIGDRSQFEPIPVDSTMTNERKNNRLITALFKQGHIDEWT